MSAHILTRSAGASARRRFRTSLSNSGVVSFIEAFLQHVGNTQIGRPTAKIAEVRASRKQRAHVAKLQSGSELQLRDVRALLAGGADLGYLRRWATDLGVADMLEKCLDERHDA